MIHNPTAGDGHPGHDELVARVRAAGHEVAYRTTENGSWRAALDDPGDLVVAIGGDGTLKEVALRAASAGAPLALVPTGTANNIARAMGISGELDALVASWRDAPRRRLDVAVARGPWGERRFVEAVGFGLVAAVIHEVDELQEGQPAAAADERFGAGLRVLLDRHGDHPASSARLEVDGEEVSGRYLIAAVMNIPSVGANLVLAPEADPGDGWLDVILVPEEARVELGAYLQGRLAGRNDPPRWIARRARKVVVEWDGEYVHLDDEVWPRHASVDVPLRVELELDGEAVTVLGAR